MKPETQRYTKGERRRRRRREKKKEEKREEEGGEDRRRRRRRDSWRLLSGRHLKRGGIRDTNKRLGITRGYDAIAVTRTGSGTNEIARQIALILIKGPETGSMSWTKAES